jgi:purine-nucleoside phosphorylase
MNNINKTVDFLLKEGLTDARIGIVLGTGLGNLVTEITVEKEIPYSDIPNFPISTVEFHSGKLIYGTIEGVKIIAMQGRFHFYEGYSMEQIIFPIRVMKLLRIEKLLISNAAGAINTSFKKGELMLLEDHINLQPNALIGKNIKELGTRFPDMSEPYNKELSTSLINIAKKENITLHKGTYASVAGPMLETAAEYRYIHKFGADAVGMSTVPEVIAANHMGLPCVAISVLTDECDYNNLQPIDISEIIAVAGKAEKKLSLLFKELIKTI